MNFFSVVSPSSPSTVSSDWRAFRWTRITCLASCCVCVCVMIMIEERGVVGSDDLPYPWQRHVNP